jgi:hypothetical protein
MSRLFDCFTFFNELDLLEIRLETLDSVVDFFVIAEAPITYRADPKPLYFELNKQRFAKFLPKIRHIIVDDLPTEKALTKTGNARLFSALRWNAAWPTHGMMTSSCCPIWMKFPPLPRSRRRSLGTTHFGFSICAFFPTSRIASRIPKMRIGSAPG